MSMKNCEMCDELLFNLRPNQKFCGKQCQQASYREKNKEKIRERNKKYYEKNKEKINEHKKKYYEKNKEKYYEKNKKYYEKNKEKQREYKKKYHEENKEKISEYKKKYYEKNKEKINEYSKKHREKNKEKQREYSKKHREKNKENPKAIIINRIRSQIRQALNRKNIPKGGKTFGLLGYSPYELKVHIESLFTDEMSWERFDEIHVDHIRPVVSFNYTTTECEDFKECWALENLQPLWATDNLSKGSKWKGKRWRGKT